MNSLGFVLQRKAHLSDVEGSPGKRRLHLGSLSCHPLQFCGILVYITSALPDVLAWAMLPELVCSALESFRLVIMLGLARVCLGEPAGPKDLLAVSLCVAGSFLCTWFGPYRTEGSESTTYIFTSKVVSYVWIGCGIVLGLIIFDHMAKARSIRGFNLPFVVASSYSLEKILNTELGFFKWQEDISQNLGLIGTLIAVVALGLLNFYLNMRRAKLLPAMSSTMCVFACATAIQLFQAICILDEYSGAEATRVIVSLVGAALSFGGAFLLEGRRVSLEADADVCMHGLTPDGDLSQSDPGVDQDLEEETLEVGHEPEETDEATAPLSPIHPATAVAAHGQPNKGLIPPQP